MTIQVAEVLDEDEISVLAIELDIEGDMYFVAANQTVWPGIRSGSFPRAYDETIMQMKPLSRRKISSVEVLEEDNDSPSIGLDVVIEEVSSFNWLIGKT